MEEKDPRRNASGCWDYTAYEVIKKVDAELDYQKYKKFLGCVYRIAELSGFYIEDIIVKDRCTGKVWFKR